MPTAKLRRVPPHIDQPAADPTCDAIAVTALAKSQKADKYRALLTPGVHSASFQIAAVIDDDQKWHKRIEGVLTIAADSGPVASSSTPWEALLLSALTHMTNGERQKWLAVVSEGAVPEALCGIAKVDAVAAEMEPALVLYRAAHPAAKRGNVTFTSTLAV